MPESVKNAASALAVHKLTLGWLLLFTLNALGSSIMAALAGTNWSDADGQTKFLILVAIVVSWTNTMAAFFNQTISRLRKGEDIVPETASKGTSQ